LTRRRLKYGVFQFVVDLQAHINRFIDEHNTESKPFIWRKDPDEIIAAVKSEHQTLESIQRLFMSQTLTDRFEKTLTKAP
jgi:hypothetical protein